MSSVFAAALLTCQVSLSGVELVKKFEGFSPVAYWDHGAWAVGYGSRGPGIGPESRWSEKKASAAVTAELNAIAAGICLIRPGLTQNQLDGYASFTYNLGMGRLRRSGVLDSPKLMLRYTRASGKKLRGLEIRRLAEYNLVINKEE